MLLEYALEFARVHFAVGRVGRVVRPPRESVPPRGPAGKGLMAFRVGTLWTNER